MKAIIEKIEFETKDLSHAQLGKLLGITRQGAKKKRMSKNYSMKDVSILLNGFTVIFTGTKKPYC